MSGLDSHHPVQSLALPLQYQAGECLALTRSFRTLQPSVQAPSIISAARREQFIMWQQSDTLGNWFGDGAFSPKFQLSLDTLQGAASVGLQPQTRKMLLELEEFQQLTTQSSSCGKENIDRKQIASGRDMNTHPRVSAFQTGTWESKKGFHLFGQEERGRQKL